MMRFLERGLFAVLLALSLVGPSSAADNELTATLKIRRRHIIGKYEADLAKLYESDG